MFQTKQKRRNNSSSKLKEKLAQCCTVIHLHLTLGKEKEENLTAKGIDRIDFLMLHNYISLPVTTH